MPVDASALMPEPLRLTDVVRAVGGWPSDPRPWPASWMARTRSCRRAARHTGYYRPRRWQPSCLWPAGSTPSLRWHWCDLARANDEPGFLVLAGTVGLSREASTTLWAQTRRRLNVPVTARPE
jgi:hypothetical protein